MIKFKNTMNKRFIYTKLNFSTSLRNILKTESFKGFKIPSAQNYYQLLCQFSRSISSTSNLTI